MSSDISCRRAVLEEILPLRHRVLRAGLPPETAAFEGDGSPGTRHYVACHEGAVIGCLTLMPSAWNGKPAWQLRGMATDTPSQGRGVGRKLLDHAVAEAKHDEPGRLFWCNARTSAIGFYERMGWRVASVPFDVPTAGPHVKMVRVEEAPGRLAVLAFVVVEVAFLVAAHVLGGPPWVALGVLACVAQAIADLRLGSLLGIVPALGWAAAFHGTGNRELFFPYAMYLAGHVAGQLAGRTWKSAAVGGAFVVAAFLAIRVLQDATPRVLLVELIVSAGILTANVFALASVRKRAWTTLAIAACASFAAYVSLAL